MEMSSEHSVKIFGINYKDDKNDAIKVLKLNGNPFYAIGRDEDGTQAINLGVYGVPVPGSAPFLVSPWFNAQAAPFCLVWRGASWARSRPPPLLGWRLGGRAAVRVSRLWIVRPATDGGAPLAMAASFSGV